MRTSLTAETLAMSDGVDFAAVYISVLLNEL